MPSPSDLIYFLETAQALNLSRAAERLGISQPSLSLAIQRLENNLGVQLLLRGKSGVKLTKGGTRLASLTKDMLRHWDGIKNQILSDEENVSGSFTLGCHPSVALYSLPLFIKDFLHNYPEVEVKLVHDLSRKITERVISFEIDFGIVVNPVNHADLVIKPICNDEVKFWTSKTNKHSIDSEKSVLICDPDLMQTQDLLKQTKKRGIKFRRIIESSNLEVIATLISEGVGIGILPTRVATKSLHLDLKPLAHLDIKYTDQICFIYRADAQSSSSSRIVSKSLIESLKKGLS